MSIMHGKIKSGDLMQRRWPEEPVKMFKNAHENKYTYIFRFLFIFHFWKDILYTKYPVGS